MSYNVYGLGNALVDMEYEISTEDLQSLKIEKGVMTLVEREQQQAFIQQLGLDDAKKGSGGSAANSMIAIAQLGGSAYYACRVADDALGRFYLQDLAEAGVASRSNSVEEGDLPTGTCLVMVTPDAERSMHTYLGVSSVFAKEDIDTDAIQQSAYIYVEGYLVTGDDSKAAAIYAREVAEQHHVKTAVSLSDPNMVKFFKPGLLDMIGNGVDLLFANEDEALGMADADNLDDAIMYLQSIAKQLIITRGAAGALIVDIDATIQIDAVKTELVDTNGAGDMFAGTYLYGITHGMSTQQAGQLAAKTAAKLVSQYGARLPQMQLSAIQSV